MAKRYVSILTATYFVLKVKSFLNNFLISNLLSIKVYIELLVVFITLCKVLISYIVHFP